jgi:hypothetical protein
VINGNGARIDVGNDNNGTIALSASSIPSYYTSCLDPGVTLDTTGYYMCVQDVIDLNPKPNNFIISIASATLSLADV